jgi:hypothetical protein
MTRILGAAMLIAACSLPAAAQYSVTQSDIQRLQDSVYQADRDVASLRSRDATRASQLQAELDELRDEVIYLKVKLRKEQSLARVEYSDVRDRIEDLRTRARGDATGAYSTPPPASVPVPSPSRSVPATPPAQPPARGGVEVPVGTELDVRLQNTLNSGTAQVEDRFEATTLVDLNIGGRVVIPAGSVMRGVVSSVEPATRTNRTSKMTVSFDQITITESSYPIRATVIETIRGEGVKGEAGRIGVGAGVGAVIGGLFGGVKGAIAGILIGGGGTIAATEGRQVEIPQGTVLRVRFDSAAQLGR